MNQIKEKFTNQEAFKKNMSDFREAFFREKYRFDQGNAFLVFVNFALLVINITGNTGHNNSALLYVAIGIFGTWFVGYFLDRVVKVQDAQEKVVLTRSPIWKENFDHHGKQEEKLAALILKLEKIEAKMEKKA